MTKKIINRLFIFLFAIVFISVGCENKDRHEKNQSTSGSRGGTTSGPAAVEEKVIVEELPNEADIYFDEALKSFQKRDSKTAASNIEKGVASIKQELQESGEKPSPDLQKSLNQLQTLSNEVKAGKVKSEDVLKNALAQADAKLANDYLVIEESYVVKEPNKLESGMANVSSALKRGVRVVETETKQAYENLAKRAERLRSKIKSQGEQPDTKEINRELNEVKKELNELESKLQKSSANAQNKNTKSKQ